jgi:hypothetical protein
MNREIVINLLPTAKTISNNSLRINKLTDEQLHRFEKTHFVSLPPDLILWLKECNGSNIAPDGTIPLMEKFDETTSIDWYWHQYPSWKKSGWYPLGTDGCGDLYILHYDTKLPNCDTAPVFFHDQSDLQAPLYLVASGIWMFFYFLIKSELDDDTNSWPFNETYVTSIDKILKKCDNFPLPWKS